MALFEVERIREQWVLGERGTRRIVEIKRLKGEKT
jgi:hypothetical protein